MIMKKEEILKKLRGSCLLDGFKEGSVNEWRCAKSYNDFVNYLMEQEYNDKLNYLSVVAMVFIHKVLSTGKKRLHRFIKPEEIIFFFKNTTMGDLCLHLSKRTPKKKNADLTQICINVSNSELYKDIILIDFLYGVVNENEIKYNLIKELFNSVIDVEATFLSIAIDYFVEIKILP